MVLLRPRVQGHHLTNAGTTCQHSCLWAVCADSHARDKPPAQMVWGASPRNPPSPQEGFFILVPVKRALGFAAGLVVDFQAHGPVALDSKGVDPIPPHAESRREPPWIFRGQADRIGLFL